MPTLEEDLQHIQEMNYEEMLRTWRHEPIGHRYFVTPELFNAYEARFRKLAAELSDGERVAASKRVGWEGQ